MPRSARFSRPGAVPGPSRAALAAALALIPWAALAAPVDPVVRAGTATFNVNGNVYTVTNAPNTIIDWRQFNVANGELMRFLQQNAQSTVLNRVTGVDPSHILGTLQSNGRVLLVNPNGVLFGPGASVDVAGLIASTLHLSSADFLSGKMHFAGSGGAVQNQGRIATPLGGSVYLVGNNVSNSGVITTPGGRILLAAGNSVSLADSASPGLSVTLNAAGGRALNLGELTARGGSIDIYGALIDQRGIVRADSSAIDEHGNIVLKASGDTTVSGTLSATSAAGRGGAVQVLGENVTLARGADIDTSGALGGGTVLVGGDYKGANAAVQNARSTTVEAGARIAADAVETGNGGKVVVWSNDRTSYAGSIFARGGALGGDGGQVETSGKLLSFTGTANTRAPRGKTGNWLLDPAVFCFYHASAGECTGAAAAGATDFNTLNGILLNSSGTLEATDFVTFLPAGGFAIVNDGLPAGLTLTVKAPYIQLGNGANVDTRGVGVHLDASGAYGTTTQTLGGTNLTGSIDIGGRLASNASQVLESTGGNISLRHGGIGHTGLHMFLSSGTQSVSTTGQLLLEAGAGNDAFGNQRNTALYSDGAQAISAAQITLQGGNTPGAPSTYAEIRAQGNQSVAADSLALLGGVSGGATITLNANDMRQTITAATLAIMGGNGGLGNNAAIQASGLNIVQDVTASTSLTVSAGTGGEYNHADIVADGMGNTASATQIIRAGAIGLTGGVNTDPLSTRYSHVTLRSTGTQTISGDSLTLTGGTGMGGAGSGGGALASVSNDAGVQTITLSGALSLTGGSGNANSNATVTSGTGQVLTANSILVRGGASGIGNSADISTYRPASGSQTITAGTIRLEGGAGGSGNIAGIHADGARVTQTINAGILALQGGAGGVSGNGNWAHLWANSNDGANFATQTINASTSLSLTGGNGIDVDAAIGGNAAQTVRAAAISLTGGAGEFGRAGIGTGGDQTIIGQGLIALQGGTGRDARAELSASGNQSISTGGAISLRGGASGSGNNSAIQLFNGGNRTQTISAGSIALNGGSAGDGNDAGIHANGAGVSQSITAPSLTLRGGAAGNRNGAAMSTSGNQAVSASAALGVHGGAGGTDNSATINAQGAQTINTAALTMQGGSGTRNNVNVFVRDGTDMTQTVNAASFTMQGGNGAENNVGLHANGTRVTQVVNADTLSVSAGLGTRSWAHIAAGFQDSTPAVQRINAGTTSIVGGAGPASDTGNDASLLAYGTQVIRGGSLAVTGGSGGQRGQAHVTNQSETGLQSIELTGALNVTGGRGLNGAARIIADSVQTISAGSIAITGGTSESNPAASILSTGSNGQQQMVTTGRLNMTGGGGYDGGAFLHQYSGGLQKVSITGGGSINLFAGNGSSARVEDGDYCNGCMLSKNVVALWALGNSSQLIDFVGGGTLTIQGGTNGANNTASIAVGPGAGVRQTITSSGGAATYPSIVLNGGAGGFYNRADGADVSNSAVIGSLYDLNPVSNMLKTIHASSVTLTGGAASGRGAALLADGPGDANIIVTGDMVLTGGASNLALQAPANPAAALTRDQGSGAGITTQRNLALQIGGNLTVNGGTGSSGMAGIITMGTAGTLDLAVGGATRLVDNSALAIIAPRIAMGEVLPGAGAVTIELGAGDSFTTRTLAVKGQDVGIAGTIDVTGSAPDAMLVGAYSGGAALSGPGWQASGARPLQAEIFASESFSGRDAVINTPNGGWLVTLGATAAANLDAPAGTAISYPVLAAHGYQWTSAAFDSGNAAAFRFILPDSAPIVDLNAEAGIAQSLCAASPALCAAPAPAAASPANAISAVVIDTALTGGVDETPLSASLAQPGADSAPAAAPAAVAGPRVAERELAAAREADDRKTVSELKQEARDAAAQVKSSQDAARKAVLLARKEAAEAQRAATEANRVAAQGARAAAAAVAAETALRAADADARQARADVQAAAGPAQKAQALLRQATAESNRAAVEARLADARAKTAEAGARTDDASARGVLADALALDARAKAATVEARVAETAHKEALLQAREAKEPAQRLAAERLALDKRIEATQRNAESEVRQALADDLRFNSEQVKAQADARQAQAAAGQALAQARRDEARMQGVLARGRQVELKAVQAGKGGAAVAERMALAESKKAEASQATASARADAADSRQRKAEEGMTEVARREAARRERAANAFVGRAASSMTASQLAAMAALRHEHKGLLFKDALKVLEQNGRAADLPACSGNISNSCMPTLVQARAGWPAARPAPRKPAAAFLPQIERKVAIVIGINHYRDLRIPKLETAVPDADAIAAMLEANMGYETRVLRDPTKADIVAALQNVARELDPNDSVVVYYAGHGFLAAKGGGAAQGYWIPSDADSRNPANWISNTDVSRLLANMPARQVMLVSDSCYSGAFTREQKVVGSEADPSNILARRSVVVMSSGGEEPVSDEGFDGHSIFAWSLMSSMKKVGRFEAGSVVFDATRAKVTETYPQVPQYGAAISAGHAAGGDYLFEARTYK